MNNAADDTATPKVTSAAVTRSVTGVVAAGALALIVVAGVLFAQGRPGARRATAPSTSPAPAAAVTAAAAASSVNADIADFAFSPNPIIVTVGSTVTWTNKDAFAHTIKFAAADAGPAESPSLGSGATFAKTFTAPGTYAYICGIHNSMTGSVTVK